MAETSKAGSKTGKPRKKKTVAVEVTNVVTEEVGLAKIQKEFSLDVNLFDIDFAKFSAKTGIEEIYEIVQKVREGVPSVLKMLAHKDEDLASIEDRDLRRVAVQDWAKKQDELEGYLERVLTAEYPPIKATAAMAYLRHCLTTPFKSAKEFGAMMADLENRKLLVKDLKGSILVGYERFALGNFGLDTEDQKEIQTAVAGFNLKVKQLVKHEREAATKKLVKAADISPNELWDGINGRCIFKVPAESFVDAKGKHRWRGGGQLLVEVTEREIIPVSAVGAIESLVKGMVEKGVRLQRHTIKWDTPPGDNPKSFDRVMDGVMRTHDFTVQDAEKYVNQMKTLWHLIIRAYNASDAEAGIVETLEDFHHRVESDTNGITPQQFFGLNGSPDPQDGLACLKFEGAFRRDNKDDVYSLFFLAKRTLKEGRSSIEVIEVPEHVNDFLGKYVGKEYSEGDDFRELPADLGRVVRAIRGQEEMAAELSK